jgi:hypothetical protein
MTLVIGITGCGAVRGTYCIKDAFAPVWAVFVVGALLECAVHACAYERRDEHCDAYGVRATQRVSVRCGCGCSYCVRVIRRRRRHRLGRTCSRS